MKGNFLHSPLAVPAHFESIQAACAGANQGRRLRPAFRRSGLAIAMFSLVMLGIAGCDHAVDAPASTPPRTDDYWPMNTGNSWTFNYTFHYRDWSNIGVGRTDEATYVGTLTWKIESITETQSEFKSTFKQKFVGVASEHTLRSEPNDWVSNTYDKVDTATTFDLTIQADQIIRLSASAFPAWQYQGTLANVFWLLDVYRYREPAVTRDSMVTYSGGVNYYPRVIVARMVGPISITYMYGGNSQVRELSAVLSSYTLRNGQMISSKSAITH